MARQKKTWYEIWTVRPNKRVPNMPKYEVADEAISVMNRYFSKNNSKVMRLVGTGKDQDRQCVVYHEGYLK